MDDQLTTEEKQFLDDFLGAFDPGPNFTEDDLILDDDFYSGGLIWP